MTMVTTRKRLGLMVAVLALLATTLAMIVGTAAPVQGAAFTVTRLDDPAPGACSPGDCSLREAIIAANAGADADVITLPSGSLVLSQPGTAEDLAANGDLDILQPVTINGAGAAATTIASTPAAGERVFHVLAATTINGVTISGGSDTNGGGIFIVGGSTTLTSVVVTDNTATTDGGGIFSPGVSGTVTISDATISGNTAGPAGDGGGLEVSSGLTLTRSTVSGNTSGDDGAGVNLLGGTAVLTNVTVSGNTAGAATDSLGGGVRANGATDLTIRFGTITNNSAGVGGGFTRSSSGVPTTLLGTAVAGNTDLDATVVDPDCSAAVADITTGGYNIVGDATGCNFPAGGTGDQVGTAATPVNPLLGPLAANGGPSTHALQPGSPALNAVPAATCGALLGASPTDARMVARPQGTNCDIGSFEVQTPIEVADVYSTPAAKTFTVPAPGVLANDSNPDAPSMTAAEVTDPANGSVTVAADGSFTYTPAPGFVGNDSFTYKATNFAGSTNTQTVTISVTALGHDVGLVDPATGNWHLRKASTGAVTSFTYGVPGDIPFMGDWDCNGTETPGLYRQSDGFAYIRNSNTFGVADVTFFMGNPSDIPLAGDFNGDGCDTVSVYRPSEQRIYIANSLGPNNGAIVADFSYIFGNPSDKPFVGDFNGNGVETIGLHRESSGFVYFRNTHTIGFADVDYFFGIPNDRLVAGDWGIVDGIFTPAVFRPSLAKFFFRHTNTQGFADSEFFFGDGTWRPVSGVMGLP